MEFGLIEMWQAMGAVAKGVSFLLIALSIISLYLFVERQLVFRKARSKSKQVAPKLADLLKKGQVKEALTLSTKKENRGSHLPRETAAGIPEFLEGKEANLSIEQQIASAQRGGEGASPIFSQELKRGLSPLA